MDYNLTLKRIRDLSEHKGHISVNKLSRLLCISEGYLGKVMSDLGVPITKTPVPEDSRSAHRYRKMIGFIEATKVLDAIAKERS